MRKHFLPLLLMGLLFSLYAVADADERCYNFTSYRVENGLCDEYVLSTYKDRQGYVWICTSNGLDRFDGHHFLHYNSHTRHPITRIPGDFVCGVAEDGHGRLWGVSNNGLFQVSRLGDNILALDGLSPEEAELLSRPMIAVCRDKDGGLWTCTRQELIHVEMDSLGCVAQVKNYPSAEGSIQYMFLQGSKVWLAGNRGIRCFNQLDDSTVVQDDLSRYPGLSEVKEITCLYVRGKEVWMGTANGLYYYHLGSKQLKLIHRDGRIAGRLSDNHITNLAMDCQGNLLVGTAKGVDRLERNRGIEHIGQDNPRLPLHTAYVTHLSVDDNGYIWVGTLVGGVTQLTPRHVAYEAALQAEEGAAHIVSCLYQDRRNNLLVGVLGKGLGIRYAGTDEYRFFSLKEAGIALQDDIFGICQDYKDDYWIATRSDGLLRMRKEDVRSPKFTRFSSDNSALGSNYIADMVADDARKGIWLSTREEVVLLDVESGTFRKVVQAGGRNRNFHTLLPDSKNRLWVGGEGLSVVQLPPVDSVASDCRITHFPYRLDNPQSKTSERITSMVETAAGQIYVGSQNNGVYQLKYNNAGDCLFEPISMNNWDFRGRVSKLLADARGNLWVGTVNGIYHYDPVRNIFTLFDETDGLPSCQCYINAGAQLNNGNVALGTTNGWIEFTPLRERQQPEERRVTLSAVAKGFSIFSPQEEGIEVYPDSPTFEIFFSALDYYHPEDIVYAYKLEEVDKEWNVQRNATSVRYNNLRHGTYTFCVRCTNPDNSWSSEVTRLRIEVHPPFYQTVWFMLLVIFGVLGGIAIHAYRYIRRQRNIRLRLTQKVEEQEEEYSEKVEDMRREREKLIASLARELEVEHPDKTFMKRLLEVMKENYGNADFGVPELQQEMNMSSTPFYKKVSALTGQTPSHFMRQYRLQVAMKLLEAHAGRNDITVSELAYKVGYNNPKYFSRCFMESYKVLPSAILQGIVPPEQDERPDK